MKIHNPLIKDFFLNHMLLYSTYLGSIEVDFDFTNCDFRISLFKVVFFSPPTSC